MADILANLKHNDPEVSKEFMVLFPDGGQWGSVAFRPFAESFLEDGDYKTELDENGAEIIVDRREAPTGSVIVERTITRSQWVISEGE